jgi:superfamily II DNA or RNA helicase
MYTLKNIVLHSWQTECLRQWFGSGCRGIAGVATGAGKTALALAAVCQLSEALPSVSLKVKIIVPKIFLAGQWRDDIMRFIGVRRTEIGLCHGSSKETPGKPFTVYVLNTARRCASRHILRDVKDGDSIFLICDECHHFGSRENARVFDFLPFIPQERYFALGLSATPRGENFEEAVTPAIGKEIYRYGLADASRDRITADYTTFNISVDFSPDEEEKFEMFTEKIKSLKFALIREYPPFRNIDGRVLVQELRRLSKRPDKAGELAFALLTLYLRRKETIYSARARLACAIELVRRLMPDYRIILFTERIKMADELYGALHKDYPGLICRYHSDMEPLAKMRALDSYRHGEKKAIVCCRALDEGLNVPETDAGIIVSASGSGRQRIQRLGRVIRRMDGTRPKRIYYLYIPGACEPPEILPDGTGTAARYLRYDMAANSFKHPGYDEPASKVLETLAMSGASEPMLQNAKSQLDKGSVRGDFMFSEKTCLRYALEAQNREKDYWIAMLLMAREKRRGNPI